MSIKLLALDLDGTVFGDDLVISERTRQAIRAAQDIGVVVTIATGRMFGPARQVAGDLGVRAPLICYQGALIGQSDTGEILYHKTISMELAHAIIDETRRRGLHLNVYVDDKLYVERMTRHALFYSKINMGLQVNEVGDLHSWFDTQAGAEPTKLVIVTDEAETDTVLAEFTEIYRNALQVTKSHPRFTEFTNAEYSKGRALAFLAASYGWSRDDVMAIGDGLNDHDMIAWAGYGVAMKTSPPSVLEVARIVAPPLADDGAAQVIEQYILGQMVG